MNFLVYPFLGAVAGHEIDLAAFLDLHDLLEERPPRGEPRAVRQQVTEGHVALVVNAEVMKKARDAVGQAQLVFAHQHHHGHRGRERLGQRREIENRLHLHRRSLGHQRAMTESALESEYPSRRTTSVAPGLRRSTASAKACSTSPHPNSVAPTPPPPAGEEAAVPPHPLARAPKGNCKVRASWPAPDSREHRNEARCLFGDAFAD